MFIDLKQQNGKRTSNQSPPETKKKQILKTKLTEHEKYDDTIQKEKMKGMTENAYQGKEEMKEFIVARDF